MIMIFILNLIWMHDDTGYGFALYSCVCVCFPIMINSIVDLTFASLIRCLQIKFQKTNSLISNVVFCANKSNTFKIHNKQQNTTTEFVMANYKNHKDKILHLIQTLRHLHLEITRIGKQINRGYCLQLLLEMAVHFAVVTATVYCLYGVFSGQLHVIVSNEKIVAMVLWAGTYSIKIVLVNYLATNVTNEAYKTGEIIQSFEGSIIDNDLREEIHQFTQQIVLNSLHFTAFGFFSIDNSLTGKFFATVTTYVVILIQMNTPIIDYNDEQHNDM
ncbi:PREDICTED: putative gustatory receptor 28b isoform X2 [Wasmannia auropunctata]|nr:PREDICTED: putative gustatory receptor 28b isoform X2 [Wasmannia auropunctata]